MVSYTAFCNDQYTQPNIGNAMPYGNPGSASNTITLLFEHLLEPVYCGFTVHWMFAQLLILHLVLALIGFGIPLHCKNCVVVLIAWWLLQLHHV